jgi:hypothetical protein
MAELSQDISDGVYKALDALGVEIVNILKAQAPQKTGALRNSIRHKVVTKNNEWALSFYYLRYGVFVDLGTYENADTAAFGVSAFDMPTWNPNPGKGGFGIRPRYWSSLSESASELQGYLAQKIEQIYSEGFDRLVESVQTRTQRNTA